MARSLISPYRAPVQLGLLLLDGAVRGRRVHLEGNKRLGAVPQPHQSADSFLRGPAEGRADHDRVFPVINLPVHQGIGIILHRRIGGNGRGYGLAFAQVRCFHLPVCPAYALHRLR